ncbi:response regulator [Ornithinicoccus halotolerans]|uniref:response regulator n=1 Tax=Ornithinicoccus halotolerans TaxID=1748220 RepID=UPI001885EACD|nr:response regulator [Ornithinicoccus halotolerans]
MSARVLVVDDNPLDRAVACRAVAALGHHPEPAANGTEALGRLARDPHYDVVLLDLLMPGTDGFGVLEAMKADPGLTHLPVIVVSAADELDDVVHSIGLGATDHLTKPLQAPLLAARLRASLAQKRLRDVELDHLRQVDRVIAAAVALQEGAYDTSGLDPVASRHDSLGTLARVFRDMVTQVRAREEGLRRQLAELRIEIDRGQLSSRVAEVTDTEHYRTLAARADGLRRIITEGGDDD